MTLWTAKEAEVATGGRAIGNWSVDGVSIDTRTIQDGDLFVALKAARDAHDFVAQALDAGASAALVNRIPDGVEDDAPLLIVDDVLKGLEDLGRAARARTNAKVVAITGSVGKTSTKEMMRTVLERQGRTHAAVASYNNHWGVPLTLARMPKDTEFAVIEIGMSNPGEISPLAKMAQPHVAVVTTVAAAHMEAFENLDGIATEKAAIFDGLLDGGTAIFNGDIPASCLDIVNSHAAKSGRAVSFGTQNSDFCLNTVKLADDKTIITATMPELGDVLFKLSTAGRHFAMNALAVLAASEALGADPTRAALDLVHWVPPSGRGTRERLSLDPAVTHLTFDLIDDAFNANPTSMTAALEVLAASTPEDNVGRVSNGRRIAVLGDMLELGDDEMDVHAALANNEHLQTLSLVHCSGPRMKALYDALPEHLRGEWTETASEMASLAHRLIDAGDVVLVKGSKGSKISLFVDALRKIGHPVSLNDED